MGIDTERIGSDYIVSTKVREALLNANSFGAFNDLTHIQTDLPKIETETHMLVPDKTVVPKIDPDAKDVLFNALLNGDLIRYSEWQIPGLFMGLHYKTTNCRLFGLYIIDVHMEYQFIDWGMVKDFISFDPNSKGVWDIYRIVPTPKYKEDNV